MNAYEAFWFIQNHPKNIILHPDHPLTKSQLIEFANNFINNLYIFYARINPRTGLVEDDESLNTQTQVWLETGPAEWDDMIEAYISNVHDITLDVGGDTFDEAIINLAHKIKEKYGDYE